VKNNARAIKSFTLTEMLLVVSLIAMVSLALYHSIANGLKIWDRSQRFRVEEDIAFFLDKLGVDVHNTFAYSSIPWEGKENEISFPTIVRTLKDKHISSGRIDYVEQIGKVEYLFDKINFALYRRQANYGQAVKKRFGPWQVLAHPVRSVRFSYLSKGEDNGVWERDTQEILPTAVRVDIELVEDSGEIRRITRLISIPAGSSS
jgi:type II secretory pathway component PulJ